MKKLYYRLTDLIYDYYPQMICGTVSGSVGALLAMAAFKIF